VLICEAYIVEEISTFISYYFERHLRTRINHVPHHDDGSEVSSSGKLSIFSHLGWPSPKNVIRERYLSKIEFRQDTIMFYLTMISWDLLLSKYMYYLNFVKNILFIYCNIINSYNIENLVSNIDNIYCSITHSWPNPKSFDYKMNNCHMVQNTCKSITNSLSLASYFISLQNSCLLFIVVLDVQGLSNGKECCYFIVFTKPRS